MHVGQCHTSWGATVTFRSGNATKPTYQQLNSPDPVFKSWTACVNYCKIVVLVLAQECRAMLTSCWLGNFW